MLHPHRDSRSFGATIVLLGVAVVVAVRMWRRSHRAAQVLLVDAYIRPRHPGMAHLSSPL
jgi:hypothetical protein